MGQYWVIVNIDKGATMVPPMLKLGEFFNDRWTNAGVETLITPFRSLPAMPRIPIASGSTDIATRASSTPEPEPNVRATFTHLPKAALVQIAAHIVARSFWDLACFAATCHACWSAATPLIQTHLKSATWAGDRILCVGDYMEDAPAGVLSDAEQAEIKSYKHRDMMGSEQAATLYSYASEKFRKQRPVSTKTLMWSLHDFRGLSGAPWAALEATIPRHYSLTDSGGVLRNLSKHVFVRSTAVDALNRQLVPKGNKRGFCLGDALACRYCWSDDPSCSMASSVPEDLTCGPWAGDRFDVVYADEFEREQAGEMNIDEQREQVWTDVSQEVCEKLALCWEDWEYSDDAETESGEEMGSNAGIGGDAGS